MENIFYIYRHIRLDDNSIFYVGKGKKYRSKEKSNRNKHWKNIVNKCGFKSEILFENLNEELALLIESELICKYKFLGINLVNYTDGGEGISGYKHTEKTKKLMSEKAKARERVVSDNFIGSWKGKKRKPFSDEHRKKLSEASKNQKRGPLSEETKLKISLANKNKKRTSEQKLRISEATKLGMKNRVR